MRKFNAFIKMNHKLVMIFTIYIISTKYYARIILYLFVKMKLITVDVLETFIVINNDVFCFQIKH